MRKCMLRFGGPFYIRRNKINKSFFATHLQAIISSSVISKAQEPFGRLEIYDTLIGALPLASPRRSSQAEPKKNER